MDTRADFQRLLEEMDKVIKRKQQELTELDERLESARERLSEKETKELISNDTESQAPPDQQALDDLIQEQRIAYEQQIASLGDELNELETINQELVKENDALKYERDSLKVANEKLKANSLILAESLKEVESANFELNIRLARAESESQMQQKMLKKSHEQDQVLMDAFNDKLESLKEAIASRDEEIRRLRSDNQFTLESLGIKIDFYDKNGIDATDINSCQEQTHRSSTSGTTGLIDSHNKQRIIEIVSAFREKDAQIELLKNQLSQATKDLENNANLLEMLTKNQMNDVNMSNRDHENGQDYVNGDQELASRCKMLENELEAKDKQLHLIEFKNYHYEIILPNKIIDLIEELKTNVSGKKSSEDQVEEKVNALSENLMKILAELSSSQRLLDIIEQLKGISAAKDAQIGRLVTDLNELDAKLNLIQQQQQSDSLQVPQLESTEFEFQEVELPKMAATQLDKNHENKLDGHTDNNKPNSSTKSDFNERAAAESCQTADKSSPVRQQKSNITKDPNLAAGSGAQPTSRRSDKFKPNSAVRKHARLSTGEVKRKPARQIARKYSSTPRLIERTTKLTTDIESALHAQNRLRQLKNENQLLELAMKEILMSIKWSDSKCSTILIDCPSLERLCQLMEARFIANSIGNSTHEEAANQDVAYTELSRGDQGNLGDLFQYVVIKSELDLLRGQNEQLRADLKLQRRDYQELLKNTYREQNDSQLPVEYINTKRMEIASNDDRVQLQEAECQTDSLITTEPTDQQQLRLVETTINDTLKSVERCQNCCRLAKLANHLLECIVRIETRVSMSDETYINRLATLYQFTQQLGKDLTSRENVICRLNRKCEMLTQQKLNLQYRLHSVENRMNVHTKICPLSYYSHMNSDSSHPTNVEVIASSRNSHNESIHSLKVRRDHKPLKDNRMTITLLTSTIDCLKAMLNYKDERIRRLEQMLAAG